VYEISPSPPPPGDVFVYENIVVPLEPPTLIIALTSENGIPLFTHVGTLSIATIFSSTISPGLI